MRISHVCVHRTSYGIKVFAVQTSRYLQSGFFESHIAEETTSGNNNKNNGSGGGGGSSNIVVVGIVVVVVILCEIVIKCRIIFVCVKFEGAQSKVWFHKAY